MEFWWDVFVQACYIAIWSFWVIMVSSLTCSAFFLLFSFFAARSHRRRGTLATDPYICQLSNRDKSAFVSFSLFLNPLYYYPPADLQTHHWCLYIALLLTEGQGKKHGHCQKSCQGFWRQCGKRRLFGRPSFRSSLELSTLRIYPKHLWAPSKACQQAKHSLTTCPWFLSCNLGGTSQEQSWPWPRSVFKGTDPAPNILILKPEMEHYFLHSGRTQHRARRRDTGPGVTWPSRIGTTRLTTRLHPGFRWTSCLHGTIRSWSLVMHMIST